MSNIDELIKSILATKTITDFPSMNESEIVQYVTDLVKAKWLTPEQREANAKAAKEVNNKAAFREARIIPPVKEEPTDKPAEKKKNPLSVVKKETQEPQEGVDYAPNGQWKLYGPRGKHNPIMESPKNLSKSWVDGAQWDLNKAIKEGPALNYGKINPEANSMSNPKAAAAAKAKRYADIAANARTIDYQDNSMATPKVYAGAADKAKAVQAKLEAEGKESALSTIARRAQKSPAAAAGVTSPDPVKTPAPTGAAAVFTPKPKDTLKRSEDTTTKNDQSGYGGSTSMMMSEKEPHKDDSKHEDKEKKKAKKIKDAAEDILDLHKADKESNSVFLMSHAQDVLDMPHDVAKTHLHDIVDKSTANDKNKAAIKAAINSSKNTKALSGIVANHVLAAGDKKNKVGGLKVIR